MQFDHLEIKAHVRHLRVHVAQVRPLMGHEAGLVSDLGRSGSEGADGNARSAAWRADEELVARPLRSGSRCPERQGSERNVVRLVCGHAEMAHSVFRIL